MAVRTAVWAFMHLLQKRFKYVAQQRELMQGKNATANGLTAAPILHIELAPLMRGAWIVSNMPRFLVHVVLVGLQQVFPENSGISEEVVVSNSSQAYSYL